MHPWKEITLDDYESHMKLDKVKQLQTLEDMMKDQFHRYPISTTIIMGIAGGNGLCHVHPSLKKVIGVDINEAYLNACVQRYPSLGDVFEPICVDITQDVSVLPKAEMIIANLFLEYVGYACFQKAVLQISPMVVSCIIQVNDTDEFVSDSPYLHAFDRLEEVLHEIDEPGCHQMMEAIGYVFTHKSIRSLPNGKHLMQLDYQKNNQVST